MRRLLSTLFCCIVCLVMFAQAPQKFSYQAVVRGAGNNLVAAQPVGVRVSLLQGSPNGSAVYVETHTITTNANGLMTLVIGEGTIVTGDMALIDWADGPYFLKTETDPNGDANYTIEGTQQFMSVPYALYAATSGNGAGPQGPQGEQGEQGIKVLPARKVKPVLQVRKAPLDLKVLRVNKAPQVSVSRKCSPSLVTSSPFPMATALTFPQVSMVTTTA